MRYVHYKDSGIEWIGEIPQGWSIIKIGQVYDERNEKVSDREYLPLSVTKMGIVPQLETVAKTDNGDNRKRVKVNDFVINSRSSRRGSCGISAHEGSVSLINTTLVPKNNMCNKYYNYTFRTECFANEFYRWGNGICDDLWSTKWSAMKNICIPHPHIDEQQQIANYLDKKCEKIDRVIEIQKSIIERLKEYKQSVITEAVTKGLDKFVPLKDSGIEWIGKIPQGWEIYKIKYCVIFNPAYSENLKNGTLVSFAPMECLTNCCLKCQETTIESVGNTYTYFAENDVIMAKVTPCFENGNIAIATNLINKIGFGSSELYVFRTQNINNKFLLYFLQNATFKDMAISAMCGTGGLKRLPSEFVKNYKLALPSFIEQQQIANYLDKKCEKIDKIIADKELIIEKLIEYKKSLIYECVTGKRKVV
ncbi:MAG: type I restriction endonuclease subunit S [Lachnospiraceae bacterium]|nr:type I restriction endonuclease subunit S [Lachnospiraceae bacterium]